MADTNKSGTPVGLKDLIETREINNTDILIVEDDENTKKVTFGNLKKSLIDDDENPAANRMWSSDKMDKYLRDAYNKIDKRAGTVEKIVQDFDTDKVSTSTFNAAMIKIDNTKVDMEVMENLVNEVENRRSSAIPLTSKDFECTSDGEKFHLEHLGDDVLKALTGDAEVPVASIPKGGWVTEDIANGAINGKKLHSYYRFKAAYTEGSLNTIVDDGLYIIGSMVAMFPKYDENEDEPKVLEVSRYGENGKYIKQRLYYISAPDPEDDRPSYFERFGELTKLHNLQFVQHFEVTDYNKVKASLLGSDYNNRGKVTTGSVYDLTDNGAYYCTATVSNLPISGQDFLVMVQNYGETIEYTAKTVENTGSKSYCSFMYFDSAHMPVQGKWFSTGTNLKSKFDGKNVHLFGDGIMYGMGASNIADNSIAALLNSKYGYNIFNHALPDATYGIYGNDVLKARSMITQAETAQQLDTAEYAILFAGSNDYRNGTAIVGVNQQIDNVSFKGSINTVIKILLEANPAIKILIVSPIFRGSISPGDGNNSDDTRINDKYLSHFSTAIKEVSEYNHIPCLDLFSESMINRYTKSIYLADNGIHLSDKGHMLMCDKIHDAMCKFY